MPPPAPSVESKTVVRDYMVTVTAEELSKRKVRPEWVVFCQHLFDLDGIITDKDEFMQFCIDLYVLDRNLANIVNNSVKYWTAQMKQEDFKQAAKEFWVVFSEFEHVFKVLGQAGAQKLSKTFFNNDKYPLPKKFQMVWNYIDFKLAKSCTHKSRKCKAQSPWDDVFTLENVATNEELRVVVIVGMEVLKIMKQDE